MSPFYLWLSLSNCSYTFCDSVLYSDGVFLFFLQAKYLAQIIVMGAQVVGRAFARALQQEFAGICVIVHHCKLNILKF